MMTDAKKMYGPHTGRKQPKEKVPEEEKMLNYWTEFKAAI